MDGEQRDPTEYVARCGEGLFLTDDAQIYSPMAGVLYLVATPIGNFDDITHRALRVLKEADVIVMEERKPGARLLAHFGIADKVIETLNEHNEDQVTATIIQVLREGRTVALVSDAGTPVFADPGLQLVRRAIAAGVQVTPIPGASSIVPALVASGFPMEPFVFAGWLSPKRENRIKELREFVNEERTVVLLETPYRLEPVLRDISAVLGSERQVAIALNLTMPDEEILRGTAEELHRIAEARKLKGEFVIVIAGKRTSSRK